MVRGWGEDFVLQLQNRIIAAHDHIWMTQGLNTDWLAHKLNQVTPQVGDLVLLNTEPQSPTNYLP
eukprot:3877191-Rhodomonas_salina.1